MLSTPQRGVQWAAPIVWIGRTDGMFPGIPMTAFATSMMVAMTDPSRPRGSLLVVGAHAADFVWRASGAIATHTAAGWRATVVALSYGERGESGDLWKEPSQTVEKVKRIRHDECALAASEIGAE